MIETRSSRKDEIAWRLKREALWFREGENTTKCFHNFVNYRKKVNTLWDIVLPNG
jgi:hypothetical protein